MARVEKVEWSKAGDGQDRVTKTYDDGSTREITERKDGGVTVVDTKPSGDHVVGDGARGILGDLSGSVRLNRR